MGAGRSAPSNIHGEHNAADLTFLNNLEGALQGTIGHATAHQGSGTHPEVVGLANDVASSHGDQMARATALKSRLGGGSGSMTSGSSTTTSGHGGGNAYGHNSQSVDGMLRANSKKPYGDVAYADPGYQADGVSRYPIDTAAHAKAAWSYINQKGNASKYSAEQLAKIKARIKSAAKKFGITISEDSGMNSALADTYEARQVPFELGQVGDGLTFSGYAAVYNSPTRINSRFEGEFDELILPGAFKRSLGRRTPKLLFNHGQHSLIGDMPLGVITRAEEDSHGLYIEARLSDNWLIQPVRDAVRDGGIDGMSFRFSVDKEGQNWQERKGDVALRTISEFSEVPELGPVVFPAYEPTTASVRSQLDLIAGSTVSTLIRTGFTPETAVTTTANSITLSFPARTGSNPAGGENRTDGPRSGGQSEIEITARDKELFAEYMRELARRPLRIL